MNKSLLTIIYLLLLVIIFTGCNSSTNNIEPSTNQGIYDKQEKTNQSVNTNSTQENINKDFIITIDYKKFNLNEEITKQELRLLADDGSSAVALLRNAIFARYGYRFSNEYYNEFFSKFVWYEPLYQDVSKKLNEVDNKNLETIIKFEKDYFVTLEIGTKKFNNELIGTWHSSPSVGSGYGERYHFFKNGNFIYQASKWMGKLEFVQKKVFGLLMMIV